MKQRFRDLLSRNGWLKWVPNALTLGNSLCGFAAILCALQVYGKSCPAEKVCLMTALLILGAMVFDAFDGYAARLLNAASVHGIQMDSLADMVTFGVAPATAVVVMAHSLNVLMTRQFVLVWCLCAVYLGCAALRLAKYNVHAMLEKKSSEKFSGLPSPGAAAAVCSVIIFYAVEGDRYSLIRFLPYYAAILGLLMVSPIQYQHFGKWIFSIPRHKKRIFIVLAVIIAACFKPAMVILILVNGYVIWAPIVALAVKLGLLKSPADANI